MLAGSIRLALGDKHSILVKPDGSVWSTARSFSGVDANFIQIIPSGVTAVTAGTGFSMVLKKDGSVWATGGNNYGQRGDGSTIDETDFIKVSSNVIAMAAGFYHSMVLKKDDTVWATGGNHHGQLGDGNEHNRSTYAEVFGTWTPNFFCIFTIARAHIYAPMLPQHIISCTTN